jgi:hypothetical protein
MVDDIYDKMAKLMVYYIIDVSMIEPEKIRSDDIIH